MSVRHLLLMLVCLLSTTSASLADEKVVYMYASYYGGGEKLSSHMANGERFNPRDPTVAAHKTLAFGTRLQVTNPANGRTIVVRVADRGPFAKGRDLDLSYAGAQVLGLIGKGKARLAVQIISRP